MQILSSINTWNLVVRCLRSGELHPRNRGTSTSRRSATKFVLQDIANAFLQRRCVPRRTEKKYRGEVRMRDKCAAAYASMTDGPLDRTE
jgi:hypothetical protein